MLTYRVAISSTKPNNSIIWDYAQTVVAPDPATALQNAYDSWVESAPKTPVPALALCDYKVE